MPSTARSPWDWPRAARSSRRSPSPTPRRRSPARSVERRTRCPCARRWRPSCARSAAAPGDPRAAQLLRPRGAAPPRGRAHRPVARARRAQATGVVLLRPLRPVIVGVATEPIPPGAVGLAGVVIAAMSGLVFKNPTQAVNWALSGFGQPTVWLIFGAYVLSVGYEKTGLGKRIALILIRRFGASTLGLGYAITLADLAIAPFTPSNTAR